MFRDTNRIRVKKTRKDVKPHSLYDLDELDLGRDHYWRHWHEHLNCGRCGGLHVLIKYQRYTYYSGGIVSRFPMMRCNDCGQEWRHPKITPEKQ